jgi:hypothetical protein
MSIDWAVTVSALFTLGTKFVDDQSVRKLCVSEWKIGRVKTWMVGEISRWNNVPKGRLTVGFVG